MRTTIALCVLWACIPADAQPIYRWVDDNAYSGTPTVTGAASAGAKRPEIRMYSTQWCVCCRKAREYMARNRIRYTELAGY